MFNSILDIQRLERINSIYVVDEIKKGRVIEAFEYNSGFKVNKTGKEVKEKLKIFNTSLLLNLSEIQSKLNDCISKLPQGMSPTKDPSSYVFEGIRKEAFDSYPKMFCYKEVDTYYKQNIQNEKYPAIGSINDMSSPVKESEDSTYNILNKYNDCARDMIRAKADVIWTQALIDSIDDKQKIELDSRMLKLLI